MGWTFYNASGQQLRNTGTVLATQAEMEAGSSIAAFVTPGRTQYHPGVAKGWVRFDETSAIDASYNVADVTDTGTGHWIVNWVTDFSSANYGIAGISAPGSGTDHFHIAGGAVRANDTNVQIYNSSSSLVDGTEMWVVAYGDHA